ncbi:hypothetical protein [Streptomyces sp. NBC_00582]|uniref:hypothetical protein n=1 Tax=Streptomyces sp. NBC_00582 TaxID=2975783 RepID=UPI002E80B925|nr:hypothetical protein [Streptomyces sp. NBC_00582]WUB60841.1 hypothetical protein OG852_10805 [Streptomyces sp. NBC_00582]
MLVFDQLMGGSNGLGDGPPPRQAAALEAAVTAVGLDLGGDFRDQDRWHGVGGAGSAQRAFAQGLAYQMISCIQRLLSDDDFARIRAFAAAAFHPDHALEGEPFIRTQMRWSRAADEHLGEDSLNEGLWTAHIMLHCIKDLLASDEMRRFLTFVDAAYSHPDAEAA